MKKPGLIDFSRFSKNKKWIRFGMTILKMNFLLAKNSLIRKIHPWFIKGKTNMFWIPINIEIERDDGIALPYELVSEFIERSSYRVIVDFCGCRRSLECKNYPADIGCLLMGYDAKQISDKLSREVSKKEAQNHLERAMNAGLPPIIGRTRIDDFIFGIKYTGRLLSVCFCCECCCLTRFQKYIPVEDRTRHPLEGLTIEVIEEKCDGCEVCAKHCFLELITFSKNKAKISDGCQGCGRCIAACPRNAIRARLNNPNYFNNTIGSIEKHVEI